MYSDCTVLFIRLFLCRMSCYCFDSMPWLMSTPHLVFSHYIITQTHAAHVLVDDVISATPFYPINWALWLTLAELPRRSYPRVSLSSLRLRPASLPLWSWLSRCLIGRSRNGRLALQPRMHYSATQQTFFGLYWQPNWCGRLVGFDHEDLEDSD